MPKIFEYFGLTLFFYSKEHEPMHVHVITTDKRECKVIFYFKNSKIIKIVYKEVHGKKFLTLPQMRNLKTLVKEKKYNISFAWIKFFVLKDTIQFKRITKRIK